MTHGIKAPQAANGDATMTGEYWVDGYNLILRKGWDKDGPMEQARERLLKAVTALDVGVRVYFDASKPGRPHGIRLTSPSSKVRPIFVPAGPADDAMIDALRHAPKGAVTIVTDDRELRGRAKQIGALALGVDRFLERLDKAGAPASPVSPSASRRTDAADAAPARDQRLSKREVDDWLKIFGANPDGTLDLDP